jgi:hypothetical protein
MMSESPLPNGDAEALVNRDTEREFLANPQTQSAAGHFEVLTASDYEALVDRSGLGVGLSQITSRLLQRLSTDADPLPATNSRSAVRDVRGSRVPLDDSPLVIWKRVMVVSAESSMVALMCVPRG